MKKHEYALREMSQNIGRPRRPAFRPENIPLELQRMPRWVCWSYLWSRGKKKWDKPPRQLDGTFASSTDAATCCAFDRAVDAVRSRARHFDGVGYILAGDGLTAIDLDRCVALGCAARVRLGDLRGIDTWARAIVSELESYTELSPSARGIRIFVRASLPAGSGNRRGCFEVYDRARYVTVTGDHIATMPRVIVERQGVLERVIGRMLPTIALERASLRVSTATTVPDDDVLLEKARAAKNGPRFCALFDRGEVAMFGHDHSRADLALCSILAFWCGPNVLRVDRLFRRSALYRKKWDERHRRSGETYGEMTIAKALHSTGRSLSVT